MPKPTRQQGHALISRYKKRWKETYGRDPEINSYTLMFGFMTAIEDLGYDVAMKTMDYYFTCDSYGHSAQNFLSKYTDLNKMRIDIEKDRINRAKLLEATAERVRRMEERNLGNDSGTFD